MAKKKKKVIPTDPFASFFSRKVETVAERPPLVRDAVLMLYAAACIGLMYAIINMDELMEVGMNETPAVLVMLLTTVFTSGLIGTLGFFMTRRRNWARLGFYAVAGLSIAVSATQLYDVLGAIPGFFVNCVLILLLIFVALVFLVRPAARQWFTE